MIYTKITKGLLAVALIMATLAFMPAKAHAGVTFNPLNPLDPFCLFSCKPQEVNNTYNTTGSYNTNSYNTNTTYGANSPIVNTAVTPASSGSTGYVGSVYSTPTTPAVSVNSNNYLPPAHVSGTTGGTTVYNNNNNYNSTPIYTQPSYSYIPPAHYNPAPYVGYVYPPQNTYYYSTPSYSYYYPLSVSCTPNTTYATAGSYVTWSAYVSGGNGYYTTYSWSGTDNLYGSQSSISTYYSYPGTKYAYVTVYSNGQSASAQCSNVVTVAGNYSYYTAPVYTAPVYAQNYGLQIACAVDKTTAAIGAPVTWSVEAVGDGGYYNNYRYSWSGTDGLSGSQSSVVTSYGKAGTKSATVTIFTPNGQTQTRTCSNTIYIKPAAVVKKAAPTVTPQVVVLPQPNGIANSLFSLQNVPWGWVAVLVILVLIGMIFYILFNKKKI